MSKIKSKQIKKDMKLSEDIYNKNGLLLLGQGSLLTEAHISYLIKNDIEYVEVTEVLDDKKRHSFSKLDSEESIDSRYQTTISRFKNIYNGFKLGKIPAYQEIELTISPLYESIIHDSMFTQKMWQIQSYDDYTFEHSVNVSMISSLIAKWLGYSDDFIKEVAISGLLHDIGKCNIPDEILNKPGALDASEFKVMKTHSTLSYILAKEINGLSHDILMGILQHHERLDGSGYPHELKEADISLHAKIVAVADVYCAMTANRVYKPAFHPFKVTNYLQDECGKTLDIGILKPFLANVSKYYVGLTVKLNNGLIGDIVLIHADDLARPLVRVNQSFYDLKFNKHLDIAEIVSQT